MITQRKIAEALGLSTSTVANILNGTPNYKKETRERVFKAVAELGYQPNRASRAIKRGRSNLIGIVHFGSMYEAGKQAIRYLPAEINKHGYDYFVVDLQWHGNDVKRGLDEMIQARVEGVILLGNTAARFSPESLSVLECSGISAVSVYGENYLNVPEIGDAACSSFYSMTRHLQSVGHRFLLMPAVMQPGTVMRSTQGRIKGFELALKKWGKYSRFGEEEFFQSRLKAKPQKTNPQSGVLLQLELERYGGDIAVAFYEMGKRLFTSGPLPDAVICPNDQAAFGLFNAAHECNLRIPEDIAVTGADDEHFGRFAMFQLTTIRLAVERSCRAAVDLLMQRLRKPGTPPKKCAFPSELVFRRSCGRDIPPGGDSETCRPSEIVPGDV